MTYESHTLKTLKGFARRHNQAGCIRLTQKKPDLVREMRAKNVKIGSASAKPKAKKSSKSGSMSMFQKANAARISALKQGSGKKKKKKKMITHPRFD